MSTARNYEPHYTVADYEQWQGDWELWNGTAVAMTPSPFGRHQLVATNICAELRSLLKQQKSKCRVLHEVDWQIADDMIVRPDLVVICHGIPERHLDYAPALIVEVVSESTEKKDRTAKYDLYQQNGVETYVIVDPDSQHIDVFELLDGSYRQQDDSEDFIATLHGQQLVVSKSEIFD